MYHLPNELKNIIEKYSIFLKIENLALYIKTLNNNNWKIKFNKDHILQYYKNTIKYRKCYCIAQYKYGLEIILNIYVNLSKKEKPFYFKIVYPTYMWDCNRYSKSYNYDEIKNIIDTDSLYLIFDKYSYDD